MLGLAENDSDVNFSRWMCENSRNLYCLARFIGAFRVSSAHLNPSKCMCDMYIISPCWMTPMDTKIVALDKAMFVLPQKTKGIRVLEPVWSANLLTVIERSVKLRIATISLGRQLGLCTEEVANPFSVFFAWHSAKRPLSVLVCRHRVQADRKATLLDMRDTFRDIQRGKTLMSVH